MHAFVHASCSLVALGTQDYNSTLVKHRFRSQRSRYDSRNGKLPRTLFWFCIGEWPIISFITYFYCLWACFLFPLYFHILLHQGLFSIKFVLFHLHLLLKLVINLLRSVTRFSPGNFALSIYTILSKRLYLILLVMFQLNSNITLFVNLSYRFSPSLLMWISHPSVCQHVNVIRSVFCHLHFPFLAKP